MLLSIELFKIAHTARSATVIGKGSAFDVLRRLGAFWRLLALCSGLVRAFFGTFSGKVGTTGV